MPASVSIPHSSDSILNSHLFDEKTFYHQFVADLESCQEEVIIESPFITQGRMRLYLPVFDTLLKKEVNIYILTRDPREHEPRLGRQSEAMIRKFEEVGIHTLLCQGNDHRKLAILDRNILWEGSLNILSQTRSREIMRRIEGTAAVQQMMDFLDLEKHLV